MGMGTMETMETMEMEIMSTMNLMNPWLNQTVRIIAKLVINDPVKIKSRQRITLILTAQSIIIVYKMKYLTCKLYMMITITTIITTTIIRTIVTTIRITKIMSALMTDRQGIKIMSNRDNQRTRKYRVIS